MVNVGPGAVATPINTSTMADPAKMKTLDAAIPLGRMAQPAEIATVVAFLAGDGGSYINGTTVFVDGGLMHSMSLLPVCRLVATAAPPGVPCTRPGHLFHVLLASCAGTPSWSSSVQSWIRHDLPFRAGLREAAETEVFEELLGARNASADAWSVPAAGQPRSVVAAFVAGHVDRRPAAACLVIRRPRCSRRTKKHATSQALSSATGSCSRMIWLRPLMATASATTARRRTSRRVRR